MLSLYIFYFFSLLRSCFSRSQFTPFPQDLQLGHVDFNDIHKGVQYLFFPGLGMPTLPKLDQLMHSFGSLLMMTDIVSIANLTDHRQGFMSG
jgi:hypothetical protein